MLLRDNLQKAFKKINLKGFPPLLLFLIIINIFSWALVGGLFLSRGENAGGSTDPDFLSNLKSTVLPSSGYETTISWGDIGNRLVEVGAIDEEKYKELFNSPTDGKEELDILAGNSAKKISINENNSHFVLNTLWAFGLVQKSKVLEEGPMKSEDYNFMDFASTAGWTLSTKPVQDLYSSQNLVELNDFQQDLVTKIAGGVYRPCCGNSTAFPDCNHGMAALGLIELEVASGVSEEQIYRDVLAFNSFWSPQTYLEIAVYFSQQGVDWADVSPEVALSNEYSSAEGAQKVNASVQNVEGLEQTGGSCGT